MTADEIQNRLNTLSAAMLAKGLVQPCAMMWLESLVAARLVLQWENMTKPEGGYRTASKYFRGDDLAKPLADADDFVAALPTAEQAKLRDFMSALGNVIDLGRANGIDVAYVNPLTETMKRLSENVITHQPA